MCDTVQLLTGFPQCNGGKLEEDEDFRRVFVVYYVLESKSLLRELLCNNSLFVGQLYKDKSLALQAFDLISFTTDLQTVNYYSTIHC